MFSMAACYIKLALCGEGVWKATDLLPLPWYFCRRCQWISRVSDNGGRCEINFNHRWLGLTVVSITTTAIRRRQTAFVGRWRKRFPRRRRGPLSFTAVASMVTGTNHHIDHWPLVPHNLNGNDWAPAVTNGIACWEVRLKRTTTCRRQLVYIHGLSAASAEIPAGGGKQCRVKGNSSPTAALRSTTATTARAARRPPWRPTTATVKLWWGWLAAIGWGGWGATEVGGAEVAVEAPRRNFKLEAGIVAPRSAVIF